MAVAATTGTGGAEAFIPTGTASTAVVQTIPSKVGGCFCVTLAPVGFKIAIPRIGLAAGGCTLRNVKKYVDDIIRNIRVV